MSKFNHEYLVEGSKDLAVPPHLNLGLFLIEQFKKGGNTIALQNASTGKKMTYEEILQKSINLAEQFRSQGLKRGDIVCICSETRIEFVIAFLAVIYNGGIVSPINFAYTEDEMKNSLNISQPRWIITSNMALQTQNRLELFKQYAQKIVSLDSDIPKLMNIHRSIEGFKVTDVKGQSDTVVLLFSSGTTGLPKAVELTHLNYLVGCHSVPNVKQADTAEIQVILSIAPWFHSMGLSGILISLSGRKTIVFLEKFQPDIYLKTIQDYKIQMISVAPPTLLFLAKSPLVDKYDISSVKRIGVGAAPLSKELASIAIKRLGENVKIAQGYGMSEMAFAAIRDLNGENPASCGQPSPTNVAKIVDIDTELSLGPFQRGELRIKGSTVMKGYYKNPKATAEAFDADGFLRTGDVAYYDEEHNFFIVDRIKELIKYKGFQVAPAELEAVLLDHPEVSDCGVVGKPDERCGELATAFIVRRTAGLKEKDVLKYLVGKVSQNKQLHGGVIFVNAIPKNQAGKILRKELRNMLKQHKSKL